jgi:hypothetical protein
VSQYLQDLRLGDKLPIHVEFHLFAPFE